MQNLQFVALWCPLAPYPPAGQARADPGQGQGGGAVGHEGKGAGGGASGDTAEDAPPPTPITAGGLFGIYIGAGGRLPQRGLRIHSARAGLAGPVCPSFVRSSVRPSVRP